MKTCNRCNVEKALDSFSTNGKSGRHPVCKVCRSEIAKADRLKNLDQARDKDRKKYEANRDSKLASFRRYHEANREKRLQQARDRYVQSAEHIKRAAQTYRLANKDKVYEWNGTRRAQLRNAVPVWADRKEIAEIYKAAKEVSASTGVKHHVDHVIPLSGRLVCGLHVKDNLQIIAASENLKKSNRVDY